MATETALQPAVREGEALFGVAHIFASFNDTFVHVTDLSGRETLVRVTGAARAAGAGRRAALTGALRRWHEGEEGLR